MPALEYVARCDADNITLLGAGEAIELGYGYPVTYSPAAEPVVDAYTLAVLDAAKQARELFRKLRDDATASFRAVYPLGRLPDESPEEVPDGRDL